MKHLHPVSLRIAVPASAVSLIQKYVWLENALDAMALVRTLTDHMSKE